jgi:large subunit ribosomal protein L10
MKLEQKKQMTEDIAAVMGSASTVYLTDFTGLDVGQMSELRVRLRESGASLRIVKNSLTIRALDGLDLPDLTEHLKGPTGLVLAGDDPAAPAKVMVDFAKEHDQRPVVKVGVVDRREVTAEEIKVLANLPSRDVLLGGIAGALTASVGGIVGALNAVIRDIALLAVEVANKGEQQD